MSERASEELRYITEEYYIPERASEELPSQVKQVCYFIQKERGPCAQ
jgi:hypothetical protein